MSDASIIAAASFSRCVIVSSKNQTVRCKKTEKKTNKKTHLLAVHLSSPGSSADEHTPSHTVTSIYNGCLHRRLRF